MTSMDFSFWRDSVHRTSLARGRNVENDPMQTRAGAEKPNGGVSQRAYSKGYNVPYGSFAAPHYFVKPVVRGCHFPADLERMTLEVCARKGDSHVSAGTV
jgi:hypothetical protein